MGQHRSCFTGSKHRRYILWVSCLNVDYAIVGTSSANKAFIFKKDATGTWGNTAVTALDQNTGDTDFGYSVSLYAENAIVGAPLAKKAFIYQTVPVAPFHPTAVASTSQTRSSIALSWSAPTDDGGATITDYSIQYSTSSSMSSPTTETVGSAMASYTLTGLTETTAYYYRVAGVKLEHIQSHATV
jgi:hypothetical protein